MKSTFLRSIGIARELGRSVTTTAIGNAGATSIVLYDATGFVATSKVTIYDGVNTEVVTASALVGSTLTVGATVNAHPNNCLVTTCGTASAASTAVLRVESFDPDDQQTFAEDKSWDGAAGDIADLVATTRMAQLSLKGPVFADEVGYLLGSILGDVVFTGGTPNSEAFSLLNTGNGQPTTLQITDKYQAGVRQWGSVRVSDLGLKFSSDGFVTMDCKASAYASGVVASPALALGTSRALVGYTGVLTVAGSPTPLVGSLDINLKRNIAVVPNMDGSPDPLALWADELTIDGKSSYVMDDDTYLNYYLNNTQPTVLGVYNVGTGAGQLGITVQMTKCAHKKAVVKGDKPYFYLDADLVPLKNTTDVGASGVKSPIKITLRNAVATGTFG